MNSSSLMTALPPPPGYQTNLTNPTSTASRYIAVSIVSMILSTLFLGLRLYTRKFLVKMLGWDDCFISIAWVGAMVTSIFSIGLEKDGAGRHMWDVTIAQFEGFLKIQMVIGTGYIIATCFAKISICFFYLRLSPSHIFRMIVIGVIVFTAADSLAVLLVFYFSCRPIAASWDAAIAALPTTVCINRPAEYLAQAGINIFTDLAIFVLPISTIWHLQLPLRQRIGVIAIFGTGFFVCIVSMIRIRAVVSMLYSADLTWTVTDFIIWTTLEAHIGVVCACLATLKPLLRQLLPCIYGGTGSSNLYADNAGRNSKMVSQLRGGDSRRAAGYDLKSYRGAPPETHCQIMVVGGGAARSDSDAESQEHIIASGAGSESTGSYGKAGVYVTRTVDVS